MGEVIVFPDTEDAVCKVLTARLPAYGFNAKAATSRPRPEPTEYVRVFRSGGQRRGLVLEDVTLTVESFATRESRAATLAQYARALIFALDEDAGVSFFGVAEFAAPSNLPDLTTERFRYTATYSVTVRALLNP